MVVDGRCASTIIFFEEQVRRARSDDCRLQAYKMVVGLQPTVIASRAPHLVLLEQSVLIQKIVDVHRPSNAMVAVVIQFVLTGDARPRFFFARGAGATRAKR